MTDDRKTRAGDTSKILYCSFCGKSQHEVTKLIAGPSVFICDECVALCNDIIREELQEKAGVARSHLPKPMIHCRRLNSSVWPCWERMSLLMWIDGAILVSGWASALRVVLNAARNEGFRRRAGDVNPLMTT